MIRAPARKYSTGVAIRAQGNWENHRTFELRCGMLKWKRRKCSGYKCHCPPTLNHPHFCTATTPFACLTIRLNQKKSMQCPQAAITKDNLFPTPHQQYRCIQIFWSMLRVFPPKLSFEMPLAVSQLTPSPCTIATGRNQSQGLLPKTCSQFRRFPTSKGFSDMDFEGSRFSMCSIVVMLCRVRSAGQTQVRKGMTENEGIRTNVKASESRENNGAQEHQRENNTYF